MGIDVRIERLILDGIGVSRRERLLLRAAVEAELARLLAADGLSPGLLGGGAVADVPGGTIALAGENEPTRLGQEIARAVYGGIGRWSDRTQSRRESERNV